MTKMADEKKAAKQMLAAARRFYERAWAPATITNEDFVEERRRLVVAATQWGRVGSKVQVQTGGELKWLKRGRGK